MFSSHPLPNQRTERTQIRQEYGVASTPVKYYLVHDMRARGWVFPPYAPNVLGVKETICFHRKPPSWSRGRR